MTLYEASQLCGGFVGGALGSILFGWRFNRRKVQSWVREAVRVEIVPHAQRMDRMEHHLEKLQRSHDALDREMTLLHRLVRASNSVLRPTPPPINPPTSGEEPTK